MVETRLYDALDRVTDIDYPDDSLDIAYTYDDPAVDFSIGRLTSLERDGHAVNYRYDRFGRIVQDGTLTFEHDKNGNRTVLRYPGNVVATYTFDYADREATLTVDDGSGVQTVVSQASYRPSGPLDTLTLGNGFAETRTYDSRYYPDAILLDDGVADVLSWDYATDAVGNPTTILDLLNPSNDRTYAYQDYQYFLTQGDGPWGALSWTYDTIGNRLTESRDGAAADVYTYVPNLAGNNSPQLDQITLGIGGVHDFSFDAAGNQTQADLAGNVIDREYDDAGRMSRQERTAAEASTDFLYDGRSFLRRSEGRRPVEAGIGIFCDGFESGETSAWGGAGGTCLESEETGPIYDSSGLLHAVDATEVLYFAGRPVAQFATAPLFLTTDHLGTPIQATDGVMTIAWEGGFEPFGDDYSGAQATGVFLRFPGQWEDATWEESGVGDDLAENVNRWYSSSIGKYTRTDPMSDVVAQQAIRDLPTADRERFSFFNYVESNPTAFIDPLGLLKSKGCNVDQLEKVEAAFKEYCDLLPRDGISDCLDCLPNEVTERLGKRCEQMKRQTIVCKQTDTGLCAGICARATPFTRTIRICPRAYQASCGPLGCTIMHELTHQIGFLRETTPQAVETCFGC